MSGVEVVEETTSGSIQAASETIPEQGYMYVFTGVQWQGLNMQRQGCGFHHPAAAVRNLPVSCGTGLQISA